MRKILLPFFVFALGACAATHAGGVSSAGASGIPAGTPLRVMTGSSRVSRVTPSSTRDTSLVPS